MGSAGILRCVPGSQNPAHQIEAITTETQRPQSGRPQPKCENVSFGSVSLCVLCASVVISSAWAGQEDDFAIFTAGSFFPSGRSSVAASTSR
jgi:hypothetical protein